MHRRAGESSNRQGDTHRWRQHRGPLETKRAAVALLSARGAVVNWRLVRLRDPPAKRRMAGSSQRRCDVVLTPQQRSSCATSLHRHLKKKATPYWRPEETEPHAHMSRRRLTGGCAKSKGEKGCGAQKKSKKNIVRDTDRTRTCAAEAIRSHRIKIRV